MITRLITGLSLDPSIWQSADPSLQLLSFNCNGMHFFGHFPPLLTLHLPDAWTVASLDMYYVH